MTPPLRVIYSEAARTRLHDIQGYIAFYNIRAAATVVDRIIFAAEMLGDHPLIGVEWRGGPTRALRVPSLPYRNHYQVAEGQIEVITVVHTRQLPPKV